MEPHTSGYVCGKNIYGFGYLDSEENIGKLSFPSKRSSFKHIFRTGQKEKKIDVIQTHVNS